MHVLFEDNHILVVNKPAGILTQPDETGRDNLEERAKAYLKRPYLHALHRLDRPVSGIVLFAKTSKALSRLNQAMREGKFKKIYRAKVDANPEKDSGELTHFILHDGTIVSKNNRAGKEAKLRYRKIGDRLLEIELLTGRRHQIRAQLAAIGCPIKGDKRYGSQTESETIALTHCQLTFPHPISGEAVTYSLPQSLL